MNNLLAEDIITPDFIRNELMITRTQLLTGSSAVRDAEVNAQNAELALDTAFDMAYLTAEGSVEDRKAKARQVTAEARTAAYIANAEWNRVKLKMRHLESSLVALQSVLKSVQADGA